VRWKLTLAFLTVVVIAGVSAFGFGLIREGSPSINTPISIVSGAWPSRVRAVALR
jgi:hypothetical protein